MILDGRSAPEPVFAALADTTRRTVLERLATRGAATATELATELPVTRQAVAKHLSLLATAGLVSADKRGREVRYTFVPDPLDDAVGWIAELGSEWDERLDRVRKSLG